jgi:putative GTP pyrophosphokinase
LNTLLFKEAYKNFMLKNDAIESFVELKMRGKTKNSYGNYDLDDLKNWEKKIFKQTLSEEEITEYSNWYSNEYDFYKRLAEKIKELLVEMLQSRQISYHYIDKRPKEMLDFQTKLRTGISYNPKNMQDLAGIRVICYVKSDVEKVCEILENKDNFEIDSNRSHDRSKILGEDKMGYSSIHYVAKLPQSRTRHEENKQYEGKFFEIQVRTILQHAWAEIQHDEMYKNSEKLDAELKRRFYLVSSILETADNEFDTLHQKWKEE